MKKNFTDLGHGGNDSGAVGINNTKESNIVLEVGTKVDKYLEPCNIENKLSRNKDVTLSLSARSSASNKYNADTFVSIHCNAYKDPSGHGLEIVYMTSKGKELAKCILDELIKEGLYTKLRENKTGLKYQNVHVCRETNAVACLIEMGFITNSKDYNLIMNNKDKFAKCIAKGICKYNKVEFKESIHSNTSYTVKIDCDILNVRSGPGTNYDITTKVKRNEVYTIVEEKNGGGKLKSGVGWIKLSHTIKK